jgi:hypothetical protein
MKIQSFTAIVYEEDDMYIAECPEVGTVDQCEKIEQAIAGGCSKSKIGKTAFMFATSK